MRIVVLYILIFIPIVSLFAQNNNNEIMDTIHLEEITTYGDYNRFQAGAKIEAIPQEQLTAVQEGGIEQLIMRYTPIYIKTNAGGLASIHIRGTSDDHTSIMFGSININSLTLGSSDLSNITSFLFDRMEVQYGSSSALNGSGAIGGAIYLGVKNNWTDGLRVCGKYSYGSFGERLYGAKAYAGNGKWESVTRILKYKTDNNFPYTNTDGTTLIQDNAAIDNKGFIQEFNYKFNNNEYFKSMLWYEDSWHEIQPYLYNTTSAVTELQDNNLRFWSQYCNENHLVKFKLGAGFVFDNEIYNNDEAQYINTRRIIFDGSMKHKLLKNLEYKAGIKYKYIVPEVYSYSDTADLTEHDADLYLIWFYRPVKKLKATVNLRQQLVSNFTAPFTPALGLDYNWIHTSKNNLATTFNASRSYRIPTFNDRYWPTANYPTGTPGLKPEDCFSVEAGVEHKYNRNNFHIESKLNAFYMNIKNCLEWYDMQPINSDKVISKGIEVHSSAGTKTGKIKHSLTANYTYNPSTRYDEGGDFPPQQSIYVPKHMFNVYYSLKYKKLSFLVDGNFTGKRYYKYSSATRKLLDSYFITNCMANYYFKIKRQNVKASFAVNNVFNVDYQNQRYYAMPGINFKASLTANINFIKNNN